jgi:hypothetical protein
MLLPLLLPLLLLLPPPPLLLLLRQVSLSGLWPCDGRVCGPHCCWTLPHDHTLCEEQAEVPCQAWYAGPGAQGEIIIMALVIVTHY